MAFEFVVEDGSQVAGSNSYVDVQTATDYLTANIHVSATWNALDLATQQALLVWASRYLDQRARWNGVPTSKYQSMQDSTNFVSTWAVPAASTVTAQSMRWPRHGARDYDNQIIEDNTIPQQLKEAVVEMARYLIVNDRSTERPQDGLTELKAGALTLRFLQGYSLPIVPSEISYIIRGLGVVASGRENFGQITRA
jgi:hypothetical protein